jgi:hypothetical protein
MTFREFTFTYMRIGEQHFRWNVLMFGLSAAPKDFSFVIKKVLARTASYDAAGAGLQLPDTAILLQTLDNLTPSQCKETRNYAKKPEHHVLDPGGCTIDPDVVGRNHPFLAIPVIVSALPFLVCLR